jgi:hypothetical protein
LERTLLYIDEIMAKKSKFVQLITPLLISLIFITINYSKNSWEMFRNLGGVSLAKTGPEVLGIIFFIASAIWVLRTHKLNFKKIDLLPHLKFLLVLFVINFLTHLKEFQLYFFKDDFFVFLNSDSLNGQQLPGSLFYLYGPWVSSHPAWVYELTRMFAGVDPFLYQLAAILSHFVFGIGIYFLAYYLTKNIKIAFLSGLIFLITTIHFEAFHWILHFINYGWQGFLLTVSLLVLVWEIKVTKGKGMTLASAFLMMSSMAAGLARTGAFIGVITGVDFIYTFPFRQLKEKSMLINWVINFVKRQVPFYLLLLTFFYTRGLIGIESQRSEVVTAPIHYIFLMVIGLFVFPPEVINFIRDLIHFNNYPYLIEIFGSLAAVLGTIYLLIMAGIFIYRYQKKLEVPLIIQVSFIWTLVFSSFFTVHGTHLPVSPESIKIFNDSTRLAYTSSVGMALLYSYLLYKIALKLPRLITLSSGIIIFIIMSISLNNQYVKWLNIAPGMNITNSQFIFENYKRLIDANSPLVNIYYPDFFVSKIDNYKPPDYFLQGFWKDRLIRR